MKGVYTFDQMNVKQGCDLVELTIGYRKMRLFYQLVFKLCARMRGHGKFAMRYETMHPDMWNTLADFDKGLAEVPLHHEYRRSAFTSNVTNHSVQFEDQLVVLTFNDFVAKMHYQDAAQLMVWLRRAAKQAKNWSGDDSRTKTIFAKLTTAEFNSKFRVA